MNEPPYIVRQPPHSFEMERALLSSMLQGGPAAVETVRAALSEEAFYIPAHQAVYKTLVLAHDSKVPLELVSFTQELADAGMLDAIGGAAGITEIYTFVPSPAALEHYMELVREKFLARQIIALCSTGIRLAYDPTQEIQAVLEQVQSEAIEAGQLTSTHENIKHISTFVPEVMAGIQHTYERRGKTVGIATGFVDLDRITGGFQAPRTYYIGARPAMGKTSLGTEFLEHVAIECAEAKHPALIFSVEMTGHEIVEVMATRRAGINLVRLRDGHFTDAGRERLKVEAETLTRAPIYIDDTAGLTILEFRARARRAVRKLGVKLIVIDYIQRMKSTSRRAQGNREQEINEIAQGISETAKELKVPIVVLAQLNRNVEGRADKTPELSDFRESGSLEQEAHVVGLLHRPSYYCKSEFKLQEEAEKRDMTVEEFKEYTELIIAKHRRGPVGTVRLRFIRELAQFQSEDEDRPLYSNNPDERQQKTGSTNSGITDDDEELL